MHKDVSLPAPTARSELNTWMGKESVKSTDYILDDKGNAKLKRLGKSFVPAKNPVLQASSKALFLQESSILFLVDQAWEIKLRVLAQ